MKLGSLVAVAHQKGKILGKVVERGIIEATFIIATPSGGHLEAQQNQLVILDKDKNRGELKQLNKQEQNAIMAGIFPLYGRNLVLDEGFYPDNYME